MYNRHVLHIDLDAFFATAEQVAHPEYKGKPVIVGGTPDVRGVVCSSSYEARRRGIKTGMPLSQAYRICPEAHFLGGNFQLYRQFSEEFHELLNNYSPVVENASIDEAYVDLTGTERLYGIVIKAANDMQSKITQRMGLTASAGLGSNKMVSKIATSLAKPRGLNYVLKGQEKSFLAPLPIRMLPGVGYKAGKKLQSFGITRIGQIAGIPTDLLVVTFGVVGTRMQENANGIDKSKVENRLMPKSISRETTFATDTTDRNYLRGVIRYLAARVAFKLRKEKLRAQNISVKIRYGDITDEQKSAGTVPVSGDDRISSEALNLFEKLYTRRVAVRLVGVKAANLVRDSWQLELFEGNELKTDELTKTIDEIKTRYGQRAILPADLLYLNKYHASDKEGYVLKTPCLSR
ncbi:DNA polymerase IV [bacterium]|nr:DNA polymerase IV [bacterium]